MKVASLYSNPETSIPLERPGESISGPVIVSFEGLIHCDLERRVITTLEKTDQILLDRYKAWSLQHN